ncbi:30S ribosomal subunit protein S8 [Pseudodesulfovibrio profundus]|uniref:Small ribosomal subunit protein uS8 n=1 Tax=Pseudodesulfovibrio profundus TaxID=57320 RepID=A0A2C8FEP6_9BACT|nr:30S ribosomal protein S8 [Pseudodesulfovibrio profundus]MBC16371.1 30S ribosomal protein S8 [Desulfovibrio sp.]SOB60896.1 30S ribosomal subunit protein S8 [Pseudodesulfovibrio profundus]|tara:strand:+ start:189 stop:572 length:384 start_codon:yes stop_codon:yes gene_type:complete
MAVVDPVADMLTRIRNAYGAYHTDVAVPASKMKASIAGILKEEGYITDYAVEDRDISITLKYANGKPLITGLKKISKPGRRVYVGAADIPRVQNGIGICIVSTSKGLLEGAKAKEAKIGGELLAEIW